MFLGSLGETWGVSTVHLADILLVSCLNCSNPTVWENLLGASCLWKRLLPVQGGSGLEVHKATIWITREAFQCIRVSTDNTLLLSLTLLHGEKNLDWVGIAQEGKTPKAHSEPCLTAGYTYGIWYKLECSHSPKFNVF